MSGTHDNGSASADDYQPWTLPEIEMPEIEMMSAVTVDQLETVQSDAYDEGFARGLAEGDRRGYEEGEARIRAELAPLFGHFRTLSSALAEPLERLDEEIEVSLVELAMAVARQLVLCELRARPEQVLEIVREALKALPLASRGTRIFLHPDDLVPAREALVAETDDEVLRFVEDPALTRGGCRVQTDVSLIDASLEQRIDTVIEQVLGGERPPRPHPAGEPEGDSG